MRNFERNSITFAERNKLELDAVMIDLDGTLIDSTPVYIRIIEIVFEKLDIPPVSKEDILNAAKDGDFSWDALLPYNMKDHKEEIITKAADIINDIAPKLFKRDVKLISGVGETLRLISSAGIKIGIVTSTSKKNIGLKLEPLRKAGMDNLLDAVITTDDAPKMKPAADPLLVCGERLDVAINKCVYVGDTWVDIRAGKAAGMKTIGVLTGIDGYESLIKEDPDLIIQSVADLAAIISPA